MDELVIRLECLKLAIPLLGRGADHAIATAKQFEEYVGGQALRPAEVAPPAGPVKRGRGRPKKEANPFA